MDHEATNVIMSMLELESCRPTTTSEIKKSLDCLYNFLLFCLLVQLFNQR